MKYHVVMSTVEYYGIDVEADTEEEAIEIAELADGGEFVYEDNEQWKVSSVWEVK